MPMIATTTNNSTSVKAEFLFLMGLFLSLSGTKPGHVHHSPRITERYSSGAALSRH